jgi:molybdopterin-guanine dinucleotide biosynthesis protein A
MWTAAILAGGQARRLGGRDKSALRIGAGSILERQLGVLRALTPHILIVGHEPPSAGLPPSLKRWRIAEASAEAGRRASAGVDVRVVEDRIAGAGALGGLYTALIEAPTEQVLVIACDMPFISAPFLLALAAHGAGVDAAVPRDGHGPHPLCASYQRRIADRLKARIDAGTLRIADALSELQVRDIGPDEVAPFDPDGRLLTNVNTPGDYERARLAADGEPRTA